MSLAETDQTILERIIDPEPIPKPWFNRQRFITALSKQKMTATATRDCISVRPENVDRFGEYLAKNGCGDEITMDVIKWLNERPDRHIRFIR